LRILLIGSLLCRRPLSSGPLKQAEANSIFTDQFSGDVGEHLDPAIPDRDLIEQRRHPCGGVLLQPRHHMAVRVQRAHAVSRDRGGASETVRGEPGCECYVKLALMLRVLEFDVAYRGYLTVPLALRLTPYSRRNAGEGVVEGAGRAPSRSPISLRRGRGGSRGTVHPLKDAPDGSPRENSFHRKVGSRCWC
jgi:hypothetical protein